MLSPSMKWGRLSLFAVVVLVCPSAGAADDVCDRAASSGSAALRVEYFKQHQRLCVVEDRRVRLSTRASHGRNDGAKQVEGDGRTPEGTYTLSPARRSKKFGRFMHISYPSRRDRERAKSLGKAAGGAIGIHGPQDWYAFLGPAQALVNHSDGCIVLDRRAMERLVALIVRPVPIEVHGAAPTR